MQKKCTHNLKLIGVGLVEMVAKEAVNAKPKICTQTHTHMEIEGGWLGHPMQNPGWLPIYPKVVGEEYMVEGKMQNQGLHPDISYEEVARLSHGKYLEVSTEVGKCRSDPRGDNFGPPLHASTANSLPTLTRARLKVSP